MAALVSLQQAKDHLRIPDEYAADADINQKVDDATAIVLDYLRTRTVDIESISIANPTVIATSLPHGLTSGVAYSILGTTTTPTVNGLQTVTVLTPTTFTVPVNVTVGQSDVAGTIGTPGWTDITVPGNVRAAILLVLTHLHENRGDDMRLDDAFWASMGRLLVRFRDPAVA